MDIHTLVGGYRRGQKSYMYMYITSCIHVVTVVYGHTVVSGYVLYLDVAEVQAE